MRRAVLIGLVSVVAATSVAGVGHGQNSNEDRARALFVEAAGRYDVGDLPAALRLFEESYELTPRAKTLLNIGIVLEEIGRKAEGANVIARYVAHPDADRARLGGVRERLAKLDRELGLLDIDAKGQGKVYVGEELVGEAPLRKQWRVTPGSHEVAIVGPSGQRKTADVDANKAAMVPVALALEAPQSGGTSGLGGTGPGPVDSGGRSVFSQPYFYTGLVALAAVGGGVAFGLSSRAAEKDLEELNQQAMNPDPSMNPPFSDAKELKDKAEQRALLANISFGVAGAAAVTTVVLFIIRDTGDGDGTGVAAAPTAGGMTLTYSARF